MSVLNRRASIPVDLIHLWVVDDNVRVAVFKPIFHIEANSAGDNLLLLVVLIALMLYQESSLSNWFILSIGVAQGFELCVVPQSNPK